MSILIVDDSRVVRLQLRSVLAQAGHEDVALVESALEALTYLALDGTDATGPGGAVPAADLERALAIDLVLLDVVMPGMTGIEACRRIKAAEHLRDLPVIMVTGQTDVAHLAEAFDAGAMDYISKPTNDAELLARVRSALKLKHETDNRKARERELLDLTQQLEQANRRLERLSSLDGLTGIPNRRRFDEFLNEQWQRAQEANTPIAVLMMDIDHFKLFNDTYGHQHGDDCLRQVGKAIEASAPHDGDLPARYGGEEFVVVLPGATALRAAVVAETARARVKALNLAHAKNSAADRVTVSIGVASARPSEAGTAEGLVEMADRALYEAKHEGRNRVKISGLAGPAPYVAPPAPDPFATALVAVSEDARVVA